MKSPLKLSLLVVLFTDHSALLRSYAFQIRPFFLVRNNLLRKNVIPSLFLLSEKHVMGNNNLDKDLHTAAAAAASPNSKDGDDGSAVNEYVKAAESVKASTSSSSPSGSADSSSEEKKEETATSFPSSRDDDAPGALLKKTLSSNPFASLDLDVFKSNVMGGTLGERGEVWTGVALFLFLSIVTGGVPLPAVDALFTFLGGPGLMLAGIALILTSVSDLGSNNLTPFLTPTSSSSLVTDGIYSKIRHPIYAGLIALCAGFSILTQSSTRLVLTALLIILLDFKSDKEEELLLEKYPEEYTAYRTTTGKFYPGDWTFRN